MKLLNYQFRSFLFITILIIDYSLTNLYLILNYLFSPRKV